MINIHAAEQNTKKIYVQRHRSIYCVISTITIRNELIFAAKWL